MSAATQTSSRLSDAYAKFCATDELTQTQLRELVAELQIKADEDVSTVAKMTAEIDRLRRELTAMETAVATLAGIRSARAIRSVIALYESAGEEP